MDEPKQIVNPEHITYREYKERLSKKPHQSFVLFVSAFFILLLAFLGMAKLMSPNVDISIGDEPEVVHEQEGIIRGNIDDRLRRLQEEDNGVLENSDSVVSDEVEEKVKIPEVKQESEPLKVKEEEPIVLEHTTPKQTPTAQNAVVPTQPAPVPVVETKPEIKDITQPHSAPVPVATPKMYKVYVGNYSSAAQAEIAKGIISESNVGVSAFVKSVNGGYTLQAGSFNSSEKANAVANELLRNNFPARVVVE